MKSRASSGRLSDCCRQIVPSQIVSFSPMVVWTFKCPMSAPAILTSSFVCACNHLQDKTLTACIVMGNSGNASPEFSIINPSKSGKSHKPFHQANSQKHSDGLNSNQLPPPGVAPFPTFPPDPPFPGPQIDRTQAGPLLENKPAPGPRTESHSNSNGGGTRSSTRNPASGEGQDKNC